MACLDFADNRANMCTTVEERRFQRRVTRILIGLKAPVVVLSVVKGVKARKLLDRVPESLPWSEAGGDA